MDGCLSCCNGMDVVGCYMCFFFLWKKAYMPIDANHISNAKDR